MMKDILFSKPLLIGTELEHFKNVISYNKFAGDGYYTKQTSSLIEDKFSISKVLLTTSCTHALEMIAMLLEIEPGDEVIMPSYTFVSTANAFILRGAKIIFIDVNPNDLNIDINLIKNAISNKTKAIVIVHYAGMSCDMDSVMELGKLNNIYIVEDAAQAINTKYKDKYLGSIGDLSTFSFHETKNLHCGEGGALLINNSKFINRAEILREKGTDRSQFIKGIVDKYTWRDIGSSYLLSEINASFIYAQLLSIDEITTKRKVLWDLYKSLLTELVESGKFKDFNIPEFITEYNAHIYPIILTSKLERDSLIEFLRKEGIQTVFHYIPLHSSPAGQKFGKFIGEDKYTTNLSDRLLRLPLHNYLEEGDVMRVCSKICEFFK